MTKSKASKLSSKIEHACGYCHRKYKTERGLANHKCSIMIRLSEKETPAGRLAFKAFSDFYRRHYGSTPSYEKFANSNLYNAFLNFGKYIIDIDAIDPQSYIDHMLTSNVPIDRWCKDVEYSKYVNHLIMKETPYRGVERTLKLMENWANSHQTDLSKFFHEISAPLAVRWIMSGRISPWVLLNSDGGKSLLERLTDEQILLIKPSLNSNVWNGKFKRHEKAAENIKATLKEGGI